MGEEREVFVVKDREWIYFCFYDLVLLDILGNYRS